MRTTRCSLGLVVGVLTLACLPAQAIVLRYQPKVGEVVKQKGIITGRVDISMPGVEGMGQPMSTELQGTVEYAEKALSQAGETTRVEKRVLGGKITVQVMGEAQAVGMPATRTVVDVDRRGRVVKVIEADRGDMAATGQAGNMLAPGSDYIAQSPYQYTAFPEGEVEINDSWSEELKYPTTPGGPELTLESTSRLLALTTYQGRKCAKLRTSFEGPMDLDLSDVAPPGEEVEGTMEAFIQGDMLYYYDYENSVYVHAEGAIGMEMTFSMAGPDMPAGSMTAQMLLNMKVTIAE